MIVFRNIILPAIVFLASAGLFYTCEVSGQSPYPADLLRTHYTVKEGLTQNEVTSIIKDKHGFMWFATRGGLNRFDGYEFLHFKPVSDGQSISNPSIEKLFTDKEGDIWIGTKGGPVNIFDYELEQFHLLDSIAQINHVISFFETDSGTIWMGTWENGLFEYDKETGRYQQHLNNIRVTSTIQTPGGTVWSATSFGLWYHKPGTTEFQRFQFASTGNNITGLALDEKNGKIWVVGWNMGIVSLDYTEMTYQQHLPPGYTILQFKSYSILKDRNDALWIGTWGNGLFYFDPETGAFDQVDILPPSYQVATVNYQVVLDIFQDEAGEIWIGTDGGGIVKLSAGNNFSTLNEELLLANRIRPVTAIIRTLNDDLLLGTKGIGVFIYDSQGRVSQVGSDPTYKSADPGSIVRSFSKDPNGHIWVGVNNDLFIFERKSGQSSQLTLASRYFDSPALPRAVKVLDILHVDDQLWIGTQEYGLYLYKKENGKYIFDRRFTRQQREVTGLESNRITSINMDAQNRMWVSTYQGFYLYNPSDSAFTNIKEMLAGSETPLCDIVLSTYIGKDNSIWLATPCGLNNYIENESGKFALRIFDKSDGMADDFINAVIADNDQNIWVSTNAGISKIDSQNNEISNYDRSDGVGDVNFYESSVYRDDVGVLYFGGQLNVTFFNPKEINVNSTIPKILITELRILNEPVAAGHDETLPVSVNKLTELTLNHQQKEFSLKFSALDFKSPHLNQYAYKLVEKNKDADWVNIGNRRFISFSNLQPGDYELYITSSNSNGVWNTEGRLIKLKVKPPPWKTPYAISLYVIAILLIVYAISWAGIRQEKLQSSIRMEQIAREQEKSLNEYKLQFFTNISHEFSTPLTLISGPVSELEKTDAENLSPSFIKSRISIVSQNVRLLLNLVNQLLEFRKMESGKLKLQASEANLAGFISRLCASFDDLAHTRGYTFTKNLEVKNLPVFFDPFKLEIIMNNLLSNAFRYAGSNGKVWVNLTHTSEHAIIAVGNSGKGIGRYDISHIFDRYYQAKGRKFYGGAGIGLALVKSFVELHHGKVTVESTEGEQTVFTIQLKKGKEHLADSEVVMAENLELEPVYVADDSGTQSGKAKTINIGTKGAKVLVVDDNESVRSYIRDLLSDYYEVIEAEDGVVGYDAVRKQKPDIVVSDVMMPNSDGFELCKNIKENPDLMHIPVILLTARNTSQDKLAGIRKGADGYLFKPFEPEMLIERIKQLVATRNILASKFKKQVNLEPLNKDITPEDEQLIKRSVEIIEKNINNIEFDYDFLARELGMSSSTLYRTMKKLLEKTPGDFIRSIRLKKAASYLTKTNLTLSEIVENVGYNDIKNFRKNFKQEFGVSPTEYRKGQPEPQNE
jgi:signal transduction histidine kinase/ligand-binding sensor domain-containing protein/DNA-binding response OmpR family regulator